MSAPPRAGRLLADGEAAAAGPRVRLDFDDRHRRRLVVTCTDGERVLIDLPQAVHLRDGARLALQDGRTLTVEARDEEVADINAEDPGLLVRLAWHLGNRHTPTAFTPSGLRIRRDHVLEAMVKGLGGTVVPGRAPFDPEPGAYHDGHGHHHGHEGA